MGYKDKNIENLKKVISERYEAEYEGGKEGGALLDKEFEEFMEERCDRELQKNKEYIVLQNSLACAHENNDIESFSKISYQMQCIAMRNSYKLAIRDVHYVMYE